MIISLLGQTRKNLLFFFVLTFLVTSFISFAEAKKKEKGEAEDEPAKVTEKSLAGKIDHQEILAQVKNYQEKQEILHRLDVYQKLLNGLDEQNKGLEEIIRQKKVEILQDRIRENSKRLEVLQKY